MEKEELKITEERNLFIKYLTDCMRATILLEKPCPHFSVFYEEPKEKYPRCLCDEYISKGGQKLSLRETRKICPFFEPKTIETKCTFFINYHQTEEDQENKIIDDGQFRYVDEIGNLLKIKLEPELKVIEEDKEKRYEYHHLKTLAKKIIQMQIDSLKKHLGISPDPPSRYTTDKDDEDSFKKWMERTAKKITR